MNSNNIRHAFANQNGQCLIIDIADMNIQFLNNLIKVLKDILTLACSVRGGVRIPALSLSVLTKVNTEIYEFDTIRGNFNKIQSALNSIPAYCQINEEILTQDYKDNLYQGINSVIRTFISKQSKYEWINNIQHIEITFVTVKNCHTVRSYIDTLILDMDISKINKISIIELQDFEEQVIENKFGLTQTIKMDGADPNQMTIYFKYWLLDQCNDVNVILHFPKTNLSIKCDIFECIINPLSLPFGHRVYLQTDSLSVQMTGISIAKISNLSIPVYELNILRRLSCSSICESTLLGLPMCLRPTQSWKLSIVEDQENQEYFSELCKQLSQNDECLMAQMRSHFQTDQFMPYFIITAGDSCLLLKSLASSDLTLPWKQEKIIAESSATNKMKLINSLKDVKCEQDFNPNDYESGLLTALRENLKHVKRDSILDLDESSVKRTKRSK